MRPGLRSDFGNVGVPERESRFFSESVWSAVVGEVLRVISLRRNPVSVFNRFEVIAPSEVGASRLGDPI